MASTVTSNFANLIGTRHITVTPDGVIHVFWSQYYDQNMHTKESLDGGTTWENDETVGSSNDTSSNSTVLVTTNGDLHFLWAKSGTGIMHRIKRANGTWEDEEYVAYGSYFAACTDGDIIHLFKRGYDAQEWNYLYYMRYTEGSWSSPLKVVNTQYPSGVYGVLPSDVTVGSNGQLHCVAYIHMYGNYVWYIYGNWSLWSDIRKIWTGYNQSHDALGDPCVVTDAHDLPHVVWSGFTLSNEYKNWRATRTVGHSWTVEMIESTFPVESPTTLFVDSQGVIGFIRCNYDGGYNELWMMKWHPDAWEETTDVLLETSEFHQIAALWSRNPRLTQCKQLFLGELGVCVVWKYSNSGLRFLSSLTSDICISGEYDIPSTGGSPITPDDLSETFVTIYSLPSNKPIHAMNLTYIFDTEIVVGEEGELRNGNLYGVTRRATYELAGVSDITNLINSIASLGHSPVHAPLWCFATSITGEVSIGASLCYVSEPDEFEVGQNILMRSLQHPTLHELREIAAVDTGTGEIQIVGTFSNYWHPITTVVAPTFQGFADVSSFKQICGREACVFELTIHERNISVTGSALSATTLLQRNVREHTLDHNLLLHREIEGEDKGIGEQTVFGAAQIIRRRTFFSSTREEFTTLRDAFLSSRGREGTLRLCTWERELRCYIGQGSGISTLKVIPASYADVWEQYDQLVLDRTEELFTVLNATDQGSHALVTVNASLPKLYKGEYIHYVPEVRFQSDELDFTFISKWMSASEVSFVDTPSS